MIESPVVGRFVPVAGGQLYAHVRASSGPTLVFLHYWGGSRRTWIPVLRRLDPRQSFVAYDQRGWGDSVDAPGPYDLAQLADDAQRVVQELGYAEHVLVGHSMGGKVAQLLAARRPPGLAGVVLVAPAPPTPTEETLRLRDVTAHAYDSRATVEQSIDHILVHNGLSAELRSQVIEDSLRARQPTRDAWPDHGLTSTIDVAAIDVPVLVLAGEHDKVDPPTALAEHLLPSIPTASMSVLPRAGHLSPLEAPDRIADHITAFVRRMG